MSSKQQAIQTRKAPYISPPFAEPNPSRHYITETSPSVRPFADFYSLLCEAMEETMNNAWQKLFEPSPSYY